MRGNTEAAKLFGEYLRRTRKRNKLSVREIVIDLGINASAFVYQVEAGKRGLKEERLDAWAEAYGVSYSTFRRRWQETLAAFPEGPVVRRRGTAIDKDSLVSMIAALNGNERSRVHGYIEAVISERN